ncbi:MAG: thiamine-phosphate pyrophosphorylase [Wolinella sp.]
MIKDDEVGIERILDANLNRLREGIRVIEDVMRYARDDSAHSQRLKNLRHNARLNLPLQILAYRDIIGDVAKATSKQEQERANLEGILLANFKRTQESARVLEETLKLLDSSEAERFKQLRYELYDLEKSILQVQESRS